MDKTLRLEYIDDALEVHKGPGLVVSQHAREFGTPLRIRPDDSLQDINPVRLIPSLVGIWYDFLVLSKLRKCRNNLVGSIGFQIDTKREGQVMSPDLVTELLTEVKLAFFQPLLLEMLPALGQDWSREF